MTKKLDTGRTSPRGDLSIAEAVEEKYYTKENIRGLTGLAEVSVPAMPLLPKQNATILVRVSRKTKGALIKNI